MKLRDEIGIGFVGYGRWAKILLKKIYSFDKYKLIKIFTPKVKEIPNHTINIEDIYNNPQIEIVFIASPSDTHFTYALELLKKRKHVFCEKPIGFNYFQISELYKTALYNEVTFYVNYVYLFNSDFIKLRNSLNLNFCEFIKITFEQQINDLNIDVTFELGVHVFSLLDEIIDLDLIQIKKVHKNSNSYNIELMFKETKICVFYSGSSASRVREIKTCGNNKNNQFVNFLASDSSSMKLDKYNNPDEIDKSIIFFQKSIDNKLSPYFYKDLRIIKFIEIMMSDSL